MAKQMKLIAIGDIHGRRQWREVVEKSLEADKIIFVGDYFDTHESISPGTQLRNFYEILKFKRENKEKLVMLTGNHDFHYLTVDQRYSGYQDKYEHDIRKALEDGLSDGSLQMAFGVKDWLFTHAGVTKSWADANGILGKEDVAGAINGLFVRHPRAFNFTPGVTGDPYGEDITQTPIWVRPNSLIDDRLPGYKQVVGHTRQSVITEIDGLWFIDCFGNGSDYFKDYLTLEI